VSVDRAVPYLPFLDGPGGEFRWRLGVRPLDPADWIELGDDADDAIAEKQRLCRDHHETVFAALDDIEPEAHEVATALIEHLRRRWPARYGVAELDSGLHPLDAAARLVPEDLVLMVPRQTDEFRRDPSARDLIGRQSGVSGDESWRDSSARDLIGGGSGVSVDERWRDRSARDLIDGGVELVFGGGSVCFPNRWDLHSKLGRTLSEVHAPVPQLNRQLDRSIDRFLERLRPERAYWRLGWGIIDVGDRYTPPGRPRPAISAAPLERFLRVERETLRRFPNTGCVLFTIRTYVHRLSEVAGDRRAAGVLAEQVATMSDDIRGYKDLDEIGDRLVAELRT
jgi:hypothetical protein